MTSEQLRDLITHALEDLKGQNIRIFDVRQLTDVTDFMIICSGTSSRHVSALAENIVLKLKAAQIPPLGVEGQATGEWVLVDAIDVIVHVMQPSIRAFYQLEALWDPALSAERLA